MLGKIGSRLLATRPIPSYQRSASHHRSSILAYSSFTTKRTMASLAAERYLADKAPPICRVEVAKSFSQLRSVSSLIYADYLTAN